MATKIVSPTDFVIIWQRSKNLSEVMKKTLSSKTQLYSKAYYFREKGVPLKKFSAKPTEKNDWKSLAALAAKEGKVNK